MLFPLSVFQVVQVPPSQTFTLLYCLIIGLLVNCFGLLGRLHCLGWFKLNGSLLEEPLLLVSSELNLLSLWISLLLVLRPLFLRAIQQLLKHNAKRWAEHVQHPNQGPSYLFARVGLHAHIFIIKHGLWVQYHLHYMVLVFSLLFPTQNGPLDNPNCFTTQFGPCALTNWALCP